MNLVASPWTALARRRFCAGILILLCVSGAAIPALANVSALDFASASSQRVTFGAAPSLGLPQFTIELWLMRQGTGVTTSTGTGGVTAIPLVTKGRGEAEGSNVDMNWFLGIRGTDGKLAADFEDMASGGNHPVIGATTLLNNVWYHVAATYDGTTWRLYLNGALDAELAVGQAPRSDSIQHAGIATAMTSTGVAAGYFDGVIDEVRVWNVARSGAAITADMYGELTSGTGLVGRWGLNENTGTTAANSVAGGVNGTLVNGPAWVAGFPAGVPAAPTALTAIPATHTAVQLGWTDNAGNETGFEIERSTSGSAGPFGFVATVGADVVSYLDTGRTPLAEYCYRVRATSASGSSDYTTPACTTLPAAGNTALDFGTGGAHVTFGAAPDLGLAQFTIETWFRRDGAGTTVNTGTGGFYAVPLVTKGRGEAEGSNVDMNWFLGIRETTNVLAADFEDMAAGTNHPVLGTTVITTGAWHHAAATYDGATWKLYLDGQLEGTAAVGQTPRWDSIQHAALGTAINSIGVAAGGFEGAIDEARVWNVARTQVEIVATINDGIEAPQPGLVARWGLNEGSGIQVGDSVVPIVNGAVTGIGYAWVAGAPFGLTFPAPAAPTLLASEALAFNRIQLIWQDNATNESSFEVERSSTGSGGPYGLVESISANLETYTDNTAVAYTEYCYRVRAVNPSGASEWSNVTCTTTPAEGQSALDLDGAHVTFGPAPGLGQDQFTLELWFRRDGTGVTADTGNGGFLGLPLLTKGRGEAEGSNVDMNWFLGIRGTDNVLAADFEDMATGLNHPVIGTTPIVTGQWYHAAATYDGATWRLYLNGELDGEAIANATPRHDSIQHAALGTAINSTGVTSGSFNGVIDEARVWDFARTATEIRSTINIELDVPAPGLVARWGLNEGSGSGVIDTVAPAQDGTVVGTAFAWVVGAPFDIVYNAAPAAPALVGPADLATGTALSPTLEVSVTDPESDALTVTFHGRPLAAAAAGDFTIIGLPDTQFYSETYDANFHAQTQWIVDNLAARGIAFVAHFGDVVNVADAEAQWLVADAAMARLETVALPDGIPYSMTVGNHDQLPNGDAAAATTFYNQYFGESRLAGRTWYGGHYGANNDNHYALFSAEGLDFIVVSMEYDASPDAEVLQWAHDVLTTHPDRRAIVMVHNVIGTGNPGAFSSQGTATYNALKDCPNLFLMMGGHVAGEGRRQDTFEGRTVTTLLADYQSRSNGGNGWLRVLEFSPANNRISVKTYSPVLDQWETDADSQFDLAYDMQGAAWQELGTVNVASGGTAALPWPGLAALAGYEWYVTVSDGHNTVTGPVWSFTTGTGASSVDDGRLPNVSTLFGAVPNPFNPQTTLSFDVARAGRVSLKIYGVDGRLVATVVDGFLEPGHYARTWQGMDDHGRAQASGTYLMRMETADGVHSRRLTLLR
jgi:hypothetical protein